MNDRPEQSENSSTGILGLLLKPLYGAIADALLKKSEDQNAKPIAPPPITREELLLEQWKLASELHRHQDTLIWNQFNYFAAFNLTLFPIVIGAWSFLKETQYVAAFISLLMAFLGGFISNTWLKAHARQTAYHKYRNLQAAEAEAALLVNGERILTLYEKKIDDQPWFKKGGKALTEWKEAQTRINDLIFQVALWMIRLWAFLGGVFLGLFIASL